MPTSAATSSAAAVASTVRQYLKAWPSQRSYVALSRRVRRGSLPDAISREFGSSNEHSTGVTVSATTSEATRATTYANPSGRSSRPFDAAQHEQRQEHERDDDRGEDDRVPDLGARAIDHLQHRHGVPPPAGPRSPAAAAPRSRRR